MNALQVGIFQRYSGGLVSAYVADFIDAWKTTGDADEALASMTAHGLKRVAEWAERAVKAATAAGAGDELIGEFELLAEAAREAERAAKG
jgi:hypothetical protein